MRTRTPSPLVLALAAGALASAALPACVSTASRARSTTLDQPRTTAGVVAEGDDAARLAALLEQVERQRREEARLSAAIASRSPQTTLEQRGVFRDGPSLYDAIDDLESLPEGAGKAIPLGRLSDTEALELLDMLAVRHRGELGYAPAAEQLADFLPPVEPGAPALVLARNSEEGLRLVRLSLRRFASQGSQVIAHGVILTPQSVLANDDLAHLDDWTAQALTTAAEMRQNLALRDLEARVVQLSYVDAQSAGAALESLGVSVHEGDELANLAVAFDRLPIVTRMPSPQGKAMTLIGPAANKAQHPSGLFTVPFWTDPLESETVSGPSSQLLVLFHPAHPEQFSRVQTMLTDLVDVPARQVFIEGMVIEIGEEGLKELGVEWEFQDGSLQLMLGTLDPQRALQTLDGSFDSRVNLPSEWAVRLRALVTERKAEILSRPSVVTLDNRQATIRVGTDIPVATSQEGLSGNASKIAFDFKYIPTGILLNVRPRIDAQSDEISLQIDTTVSAAIAGQDLELRDEDGRVLASAPTIASRRVQTFARIPNNTPLIIGGLVSRQDDFVQQKVPLLGDLPLIGPLFRSERWEQSKREVIIVLTPYVLPEGNDPGRMHPRTESAFDIRGFRLHRDVHRLREAEVFDLTFLTTNDRLVEAKRQVNDLVRRNFRFASISPFRELTGDSIPGEHVLVERMMYEVVKNLDLASSVDPARIIYFGEDQNAGYRVRFLRDLLADLGAGAGDIDSFFAHNPGSAIAIRYYFDRHTAEPGALGAERIPEITLVDCADRAEWRRLLWDLNQPDAQGRPTAAVLIHQPQDLLRLRRAIVLKRMALLNGGIGSQRLKHFNVGTMLQIPEVRANDVQVIDADVAKLFFHTEHYYSATIARIEQSLGAVHEALPKALGGSIPTPPPGR
jgi:hypothetical protein